MLQLKNISNKTDGRSYTYILGLNLCAQYEITVLQKKDQIILQITDADSEKNILRQTFVSEKDSDLILDTQDGTSNEAKLVFCDCDNTIYLGIYIVKQAQAVQYKIAVRSMSAAKQSAKNTYRSLEAYNFHEKIIYVPA